MTTRIRSYENLVMLLMGLAFGFVFFDRLALSFLAPFLVTELRLNNTQLGLLASALALTWAASGYMFGILSDYFGRRKVLLVTAIILFSVCSIVSGLATSFLMLLGARLVMGLAEGPVLPIAQSIMSAESSEHRRGFNMGVLQNFFNSLLSYFAAPLILVAIANNYGWRNAFFITAIPGFTIALVIAFLIREPRKPVSFGTAHTSSYMSPWHMFGYRNIWLCMLISCLMISWLIIQLTFLPMYLVQIRGMSVAEMSMIMSALGIAAAFASFAVPALSDRFGRRTVISLFAFVGVLTPLAAIAINADFAVVLIGSGFLAIGCFSIFMATVPSETIAPSYVASALGLIMGVGEIVGGVVGPLLAGIGADRMGLATPMWIAAGATFLAGVLSLVETAPRLVSERLLVQGTRSAEQLEG
jgi:MFS family permease